MGYVLLIAGVALFAGAHVFKRVAPGARDRLGEGPGKGLVAVLLVASIVLMSQGYGRAEYLPLWQLPFWVEHIVALLMLPAAYLFFVTYTKGVITARLRHPQLTAVKLWAVLHLSVNGDLPSLILFGGLLAWAVAEVILINRSQPWARPADVSIKGDAIAAGVGLVAYVIATYVHIWQGVWPFGA
jgi:uncharacterized membrane protein